MTDRYEKIRQALADMDAAAEARNALAWRDAHARFVVHVAPDTIRELLEERDALREALKVLVCWTPSADTYRRLGFNPEAPMRAHEAAKAALALHQSKGKQIMNIEQERTEFEAWYRLHHGLACGAECATAVADLAARMNVPFERT